MQGGFTPGFEPRNRCGHHPNDCAVKVILKTGDRMELRGVPQGRGLVFAMSVCAGIAVVCGLFVAIGWTKKGPSAAAFVPGAGMVLMLLMLCVLVLLSFRRERLVFDKVTNTAEYETWNRLIGSRKVKSYPFDRIHGVAVERSLQAKGGGKGFPTQVTKARLLISRPRRAIDMDEVQSGSADPVEALAREVSEFLGCALTTMGSHEEAERKRGA